MVADIQLNKALSLDELQEMVIQAREFESRIHLIKECHEADVKSILGLACLSLHSQDEVRLDVCGNDEKEAFRRILRFLN